MSDFDGVIDPTPAWPDVPQLSTSAQLIGGEGGVFNAQAVALAARTKKLNTDKASKTELEAVQDIAEAATATAEAAALAAAGAADVAGGIAGDVADAVTVANNAAILASEVSIAVEKYPRQTTELSANGLLASGNAYVLAVAGLTVTLPAAPAVDDLVTIIKPPGSGGNATVARNGSKIMSLAEDMTIDVNNVTVKMQYINSTNGWVIL